MILFASGTGNPNDPIVEISLETMKAGAVKVTDNCKAEFMPDGSSRVSLHCELEHEHEHDQQVTAFDCHNAMGRSNRLTILTVGRLSVAFDVWCR